MHPAAARPFHVLGAAYAALSVALWGLQYTELVEAEIFRGGSAHAHEMVFGFAMAIVAGIAFTVTPASARQAGARDGWLWALVALWIAGRVMAWTPYDDASKVVNAAFPLALAARVGLRGTNAGAGGSLGFAVLLVAMAAAQWAELRLGLDVLLFLIAAVAGRVVPRLTNEAIPDAGAVRSPWLERAALATIIAVALVDAFGLEEGRLPEIALAAALLANALRWVLWKPWRTLGTPRIWILHASFLWIVAHFALRLGVEHGAVMVPYATHALTVGGIGGMAIALVTRSPAAYLLVQAAVVSRVLVPMAVPSFYVPAVGAAAACWFAAFTLAMASRRMAP